MFIRLDIDSDNSICVDHANIIIEKSMYYVDDKPVYAVGVFAITTVANFDDGVVSSAVSFQKKSSYRQLIYSREFRVPDACEKFYADIVTQMNETIKQTLSVNVDTKKLEQLLQIASEQTDHNLDYKQVIEETMVQQNRLLENLVVLLTPKEKPAKSRAKKKDVLDAP